MLIRCNQAEGALAAGGESAEIEQLWPHDGVVRAYALDAIPPAVPLAVAQLVHRAGIGLAIYRRSREMVYDDLGRQFLPGCASGAADLAAVDWSELLLPVKSGELWILQIRNDGPDTVTPRLIFDVTYVGEEERTWAQ